MKKLFLVILTTAIAFASKAQSFPDSVANKEVTVSLKGKYHGLIYALMPDKGTTDAINYVNQLARYKKADNSFDTAQVMPVTIKYKMVTDVYLTLGSNQERLTAADNAEMKKILKDELSVPLINGVPKYMALLLAIKSIDDANTLQTELIRQSGVDKIIAIKIQ